MTCVANHMDVTWICKLCGAINNASNSSCSDCSSTYASGPQTTNQALLNNGVIFNNAVFNPQPSVDQMISSIEEFYQIDQSDIEDIPPRESLGMRVFTWTLNVLMWLAIIVSGSIFLFFVVVVIAAFCKI